MPFSDRYVEKTRTWQDNWNNVIRNVLFQDDKLKELMLVPKGTDIITFQTKYFIRDGSTDELLTNEKVRIVHHDDQGSWTFNKDVIVKYKNFDIYVNEDVEHTADVDSKCKTHATVYLLSFCHTTCGHCAKAVYETVVTCNSYVGLYDG